MKPFATFNLARAFSLYFILCFFVFKSSAQVGIGNTDPHASSMLDISSDSQGILIPRMTTADRTAIATPANSLMVFDTDERAYYYYDEPNTIWIRINSSRDLRDNFVLVKELADFPAPAGGVITLDTNTFYEINGTINLGANTIHLNNAYVAGMDANEDRLIRAGGPIFSGSTGGSIKQLTLLGGGGASSAFNITGATGQRLLLQNTIVANFSSVGTLSGLALFFSNIVQFSNNTAGIVYNNIGTLLLSNQAWFGDNGGSFETLTGTFDLVQKVSGFSTVPGGATGFNVASNPTVGEGILLSTLFTGAGTYVNRYTTAYPGFNFNNNWVVNAPGIPRESDNEATGNIYFNGALATGFAQNIPTSLNEPFNLNSNTTTLAPNNFRVTSPANNRLTYQGRRTQTFQVNATLAVRANSSSTTNLFFSFFFRKNGTETLVPTNTVVRTPAGFGAGSEIISLSISGTVELAPGEYIEIWGQRLTGNATVSSPQLAIFAVNMNMK